MKMEMNQRNKIAPENRGPMPKASTKTTHSKAHTKAVIQREAHKVER
jgi:hypothetical protein